MSSRHAMQGGCAFASRPSVTIAITGPLLQRQKQAALVFGGMVDWLDRGFEVEMSETVAKRS